MTDPEKFEPFYIGRWLCTMRFEEGWPPQRVAMFQDSGGRRLARLFKHVDEPDEEIGLEVNYAPRSLGMPVALITWLRTGSRPEG